MAEGVSPDLQPIAFLLGTWRGGGIGRWPAGADPFRYEEEMRFEPGGAAPDFPFFAYVERAWDPDSKEVLHREVGFWRCHEDSSVDAALAHPIAVTEVTEGKLEGLSITLASKHIARATNSDAVTRLERRYRLEGDSLVYELEMATAEEPLTVHLQGRLSRA